MGFIKHIHVGRLGLKITCDGTGVLLVYFYANTVTALLELLGAAPLERTVGRGCVPAKSVSK